MDDLHGSSHVLIGVGDNQQMRKRGLRCLGRGLIIVGDDDDADSPSGKLGLLLFELNQLDHADCSPAATEEYQGRAMAIGEICAGECRSIGERRSEFRHRTARPIGPGVRGRLALTQDEMPFESAQHGKQQQADASPHSSSLPDRNGHAQHAEGSQCGDIPRHRQAFHPQLDEINSRACDDEQNANQEQRPVPWTSGCGRLVFHV
jgi:hypothetical protein